MYSRLIVWLIYQYPEVLMLTLTGPRLLGLHISSKKLMLSALAFSMLVPLSRAVVPTGFHAIILFSLFTIFISWLYQISWFNALPPAMLSFSLLLIGDVLVVPAFMDICKMNGADIFANAFTHVLVGYLSCSVLFIFFLSTLAGLSLVNTTHTAKKLS